MDQRFIDRISTKKGRALYVIAQGKDLTKLEVKERGSLSMSTVISAVDSLVKEGLVTMGERRTERGGKPHAVLNPAPDRCVYGISYKSGKLYAAALDLRGEVVGARSLTVAENLSPTKAVNVIAARLAEEVPAPLVVALALNCRERDELLASLCAELGAEILLTTNTAALAHRALWEGEPYPLVTIGIGGRVKCAYLDRDGYRAADLSDLTLAPVFSRGKGCGAVLSASRVEEILFSHEYAACRTIEGERLSVCRDLADYSRALVRAIVSLAEAAETFYAPREIRLFGEYLTKGFFDRILAEYGGNVPLIREQAEGGEFARSAALFALISRFFS